MRTKPVAVLLAAGAASTVLGGSEVRIDLVSRPPTMPHWGDESPCPKTGAYGQALLSTDEALWVVRDATATSTPNFWRYDPWSDSWENRDVSSVPDGNFRNGTAMAWDQDTAIYALGGARYEDRARTSFWRYEISVDSWTELAPTPGAQGAGNALTWSGWDQSLYAMLGSRTHGTRFVRYRPDTETWTVLSAPPERTDDGAALAWAGGPKLYALSGEYKETSPVFDFWEYDISTDTWSYLADVPDAGGVGDGGSLLWAGDFDSRLAPYLYATSGGAFDETPGTLFLRYSIARDEWYPMPSLPYEIGYYNGNRLGFVDGRLFLWQAGRSNFIGGGRKLISLQ